MRTKTIAKTLCDSARRTTAKALQSGIFKALWLDRSGSYAISTGLLVTVMAGFAGLGTDVALWHTNHRLLQDTTDSAAISAATAIRKLSESTNFNIEQIKTEARAIAARYGFINGVKGATVAINTPPKSGPYKTFLYAVEVIISQPQPRYFSVLYSKSAVTAQARSVALADEGTGCVLALNRTEKSAASNAGTSSIKLRDCSLYDNSKDSSALTADGSSRLEARSVGVVGGITGGGTIITTHGVATGISPVGDPYANVSYPPYSGCNQTGFSANSTMTINPGVYCNGMKINAGANVTFNPGIYYIDRGTLAVSGGATISGEGVTIVFTSSTGSNWGDATINGGSTVKLTAPESGPTAGIVMFGDRKMPTTTTFTFNGGAGQNLVGSLYFPKGYAKYAGGADTETGCTQLIADTITFTGNSYFALDCDKHNIRPMSPTAKLVE